MLHRNENLAVRTNAEGRRRFGRTIRTVLQNVLIYGLAGAIIWYEARGIPVHTLLSSLANANLFWFIPATLLSFCIWFFGENLLYSRMFTYFHEQTGYIELLPATAAAYFLQVINILVADGALILFLHRRKDVPWLAGGFTILFLGFIDGFLFSLLTVLSGLLIPGSPLRPFLPYAAAALGALSLVPAWWIWWTPRTRFERWLHNRPALVSFRTARPRTYLELGAIRIGIFVPQGFIFYVSMLAFHIHIPLLMVLAVTPAILAAGGVPFTPIGLGPLQAVAVHGFSQFASTTRVLAMYLSMSVSQLVYRLPLGLGSAGAYAKTILGSGHRQPADRPGDRPATDRSANDLMNA
jgi:uncharacterized membrane protein YbhN (UPF0104 family)